MAAPAPTPNNRYPYNDIQYQHYLSTQGNNVRSFPISENKNDEENGPIAKSESVSGPLQLATLAATRYVLLIYIFPPNSMQNIHTKYRKGKKNRKKERFVKYQGPISFGFMYDFNNGQRNKKFSINNGDSCYVEYNGKLHAFQVDIFQQNAIKIKQYVPGKNDNGIKLNKNCILLISSKFGVIARFKVFCSKHNDKLCFIYLTKFEDYVHQYFVSGVPELRLIRSTLEIINTRKLSEPDEEGKSYFIIPSFGIFIKKTN